MADLPILFSAPMVRALIDDRKKQTRRLVQPQPHVEGNGSWRWEGRRGGFVGSMGTHVEKGFPESAKHWNRIQPGDRLYVREAWRTLQKWDDLAPRLLADDRSKITYEADPEGRNPLWAFGRLRASMHMPRWASRITLIVENVKVERLQGISEEDAIAEGIEPAPDNPGWWKASTEAGKLCPTPWDAYADLWTSINGEGSWQSNPWIVAYSFRRIMGNIDQIDREAA